MKILKIKDDSGNWVDIPSIKGDRGPEGPRGHDGNPIGTIISLMGRTAPNEYLECNGAIYNIADFQELSSYFSEQFGSSSYFGGDGVTTFAVPDLRNLFLRGYHGEASVISGEIGIYQDATRHKEIGINIDVPGSTPNIMWAGANAKTESKPENVDWYGPVSETGFFTVGNLYTEMIPVQYYTSRPANMAVLYCIKCV